MNVDSCLHGIVSVYPNPANDHIVVQLDVNDSEPKYFNLLDSRGAQVLSQELKYRTTIDVSNLSAGIYFYSIRVGFGKKLKAGKLIIRH
ncbi:MAG: T9SS type A sorting domain-containing protein [Chitinophagaceae bacterium]|nr:T9SS type A sorting domain-containing protein [Chitinophagaceae bacterium]